MRSAWTYSSWTSPLRSPGRWPTWAVDGFRSCLLGTEPHSWGLVGAGAALSIALFAAGLLVFDRTQAALVDEM